MEKKEYEISKSKFFETYANVPEPLRREIIAVVDDETFTWQTAKAEIMNDTKSAKKILESLLEIGVIKNE